MSGWYTRDSNRFGEKPRMEPRRSLTLKRSCTDQSSTDGPTHPIAAADELKLDGCVLYAGCIGRLGRFGNQIFQYLFAVCYSEARGLDLRTPAWLGAFALVGARAKLALQALPPASKRVLLADRTVLSHAGWREWAAQREPLRSHPMVMRGDRLSGRQIRREMPQVHAESLAASSGACVTGADHLRRCLHGGCHPEQAWLWGFFQFKTKHLATHKDRIQAACRVIPAIQTLVDETLRRLVEAGGTLVCVHVRCRDDMTGLPAPGDSYLAHETHAGFDDSWKRRSAEIESAREEGERIPPAWIDDGVCWSAPVDWYVTWLRTVYPKLCKPQLLVCSDDGDAAMRAFAEFAPVQLAPLLLQSTDLWAAAHSACGNVVSTEGLLAVCDWASMQSADVLAIGNSTFSFSASLAARLGRERERHAAIAESWRPDPTARAIVAFECAAAMRGSALETASPDLLRALLFSSSLFFEGARKLVPALLA